MSGDRKYQIFISSTYEDLQEERKAVETAVLKLGHIPIGMENFTSADDDSWDYVRQRIDETDFYVVIVARRYGSLIESEGISFTEKELDYAIERGVPVLAFLLSDDARWPHDESQEIHRDKLKALKEKLLARIVTYWSTASQLAAECTAAIATTTVRIQRPGWVRNHAGSAENLEELARLSRENAELRHRLQEANEVDVSGSLFPDPRIKRLAEKLQELVLDDPVGVSVTAAEFLVSVAPSFGASSMDNWGADPRLGDSPVDRNVAGIRYMRELHKMRIISRDKRHFVIDGPERNEYELPNWVLTPEGIAVLNGLLAM